MEDFTNEEELTENFNEFQFETDHLALRGNKDYLALMKYIISLEVQKVRALNDIEDIAGTRAKALEDPLSFVNDLRNGVVKLPGRQTVPDLPQIDWSCYGLDENFETEKDVKPQLDSSQADSQNITVRGRVYTESKPDTFNQLWTCEEQRRLEELLEIYPEEEVESKRFQKIADALGTRTLTQVRSRIQKYFAKLAKAGLRIPGRRPRGSNDAKNAPFCSKNNSKMFYKKSTFFPQLHVPVQMEEMQSEDGEEIAKEIYSESFQGIVELLKAAKEQRELDEKFPVLQTNVMCVGCYKKEFVGARWTDGAGTDYCTDCIVRLQPTERLTPIRKT